MLRKRSAFGFGKIAAKEAARTRPFLKHHARPTLLAGSALVAASLMRHGYTRDGGETGIRVGAPITATLGIVGL